MEGWRNCTPVMVPFVLNIYLRSQGVPLYDSFGSLLSGVKGILHGRWQGVYWPLDMSGLSDSGLL